MGNVNIVIMLLKNIKKERVKFRLKVFLLGGGVGWGSLLDDTGFSYQILAPTLEKVLFCISNVDFLMSRFLLVHPERRSDPTEQV